MTAAVIISSIAAIVGIGVATWSLIDTRKRYNEERTKGKHLAND